MAIIRLEHRATPSRSIANIRLLLNCQAVYQCHNLHNRYMNIPDSQPTSPGRNESDREDIMREATALKRRMSLRVAGMPEPIVAGFRTNDYFSVFFDQDPVYQYDNQGQLRRAYLGGLLYRTQGNTLAQLKRVRTETQTVLQREDLNSDQLAVFLTTMSEFISRLLTAFENGTVTVLETIPDDPAIADQVTTALRQVTASDVALAPAMPTRRS